MVCATRITEIFFGRSFDPRHACREKLSCHTDLFCSRSTLFNTSSEISDQGTLEQEVVIVPSVFALSAIMESCMMWLVIVAISLSSLNWLPAANALTPLAPPPTFGLASLLFPVRKANVITYSELLEAPDLFSYKSELVRASDFFVDAFWTAKVGGGTNQLSSSQQQELRSSQLAEFQKRYGKGRLVNKSQFFVVRSGNNQEILACAGIELDVIRDGGVSSPQILEKKAPLMSNLAVSREYRRRGLAELMVDAVEEYVRQTWTDQEACYLLVEQRNRGAVKLYQKLGYKTIWSDNDAQTLLPQKSGKMNMVPTVMLCMKKNIKRQRMNPFGNWFR